MKGACPLNNSQPIGVVSVMMLCCVLMMLVASPQSSGEPVTSIKVDRRDDSSESVVKARVLLWSHWQDRVAAEVEASYYSREGQKTIRTISLKQRDDEEWYILDRLVRVDGSTKEAEFDDMEAVGEQDGQSVTLRDPLSEDPGSFVWLRFLRLDGSKTATF